MKLNRATLQNNVPFSFEDEIDFSKYEFDKYHIKEISSCLVKAVATDFDSLLSIKVNVKAKVVAVCAYSLEDVPLTIKVNDELFFTDKEENDDEAFYEKDVNIVLDPYILALVLDKVPIKVIKKGKSLPEGGNGYRVISEETYEKEHEEKHDSRWDILDSLDLD